MKERPFFGLTSVVTSTAITLGIAVVFMRCMSCLDRIGMYLSSPGIRGIRNHALQFSWHIDFSYFVQYTKPYKERM